MCFCASASFMAGAPLAAVGGVTLSKAKTKSQLPFAAVPLLFGIQQAIEGVVWVTFSQSLAIVHMIATYGYAIFAYVLWPIFLPFAILLLETVPWRKKVLMVLQSLGLVVGLYLLYFIFSSHVTSHVVSHSIVYSFWQPFGKLSIGLYLIAGCLSFFFSSKKIVNFLGGLLTVSLAITYFFYTVYVVSVWCFFSALLSSVILFYFIKQEKEYKKATHGA
ncbi:MAG: DUF6629 family protein [Candidatus Levyibacteriota bacterium]